MLICKNCLGEVLSRGEKLRFSQAEVEGATESCQWCGEEYEEFELVEAEYEEREWKYDHFYGNKISQYGKQNGYVDYRALAASFNHVLNNDIIGLIDDFEIENGNPYEEVFQWYIIDENGADILKHWTSELVFYSRELNMYLWGVTHYGTAWDYVLTDIKVINIA